MNHGSVIVLVAAAVFCSAAFAQEDKPCQGVNEAKYPCGRRCEERCNVASPVVCKLLMCLGFSCRCKNGFARNAETGECVRPRDCPASPCAFGEVLGMCGKICEGTCSNHLPSNACRTANCSDMDCQCDLTGGFVRNEKTGQCVKVEDC